LKRALMYLCYNIANEEVFIKYGGTDWLNGQNSPSAN